MATLVPPSTTHVCAKWQLAADDADRAVKTAMSDLKRDGYVVFRNFFSPETIAKAVAEIDACLQADIDERAALNHTDEHHKKGQVGHTIQIPALHLLIDCLGMCPTFDAMFETFLTHPVTRGVMNETLGPNMKLRGYNVRKMTGAVDQGPFPGKAHSIPLEWHIDSPRETCISFLLNDIDSLNDSPTALIPGSHMFPYHPLHNTLFSYEKYPGHRFFLKHNLFNKLLGQRIFAKADGGTGKAGDVVIFINDTWHGRHPNLNGKQTMISLAGLFSSNDPYPDEVPVPSDEVLAKLPPQLRAVVDQSLPPNPNHESHYICQMQRDRKPVQPLSLFHLAQVERKFAEWASRFIAKK